MNNLKLFSLVFGLLFVLIGNAQSQESLAIAQNLKSGNAKGLSQHFLSSLDLTLNNKDDIYSASQAEAMLVDFFSKHKPQSLTIEHEGKSKSNDYYKIGTLRTSNGTFRITYFLKQDGSAYRVKQLRIEPIDR